MLAIQITEDPYTRGMYITVHQVLPAMSMSSLDKDVES